MESGVKSIVLMPGIKCLKYRREEGGPLMGGGKSEETKDVSGGPHDQESESELDHYVAIRRSTDIGMYPGPGYMPSVATTRPTTS
jgi:hypothetical protein